MANKTVSFRLPDEIVSAIEAHADVTGQTRTAVIVDALAKSLEVTKVSPDSSLQQQVSVLEQQVVALEQEKA